MKGQLATGFLPYEVGDKVLLKDSTEIETIEDIRMIQYIKVPRVEFEVQLAHRGPWVPATLIQRRLT